MKATRKPKYNTRVSSVTTNAVIMNKSDWKRVKQESVHMTPRQIQELKAREEAQKREQLMEITKKRQTLIDYEIKPEILSKTHSALETFEERDYAYQLAESKADEDLDEVKKINSEIVAAKSRTFRDQQLAIHQQQKEEEIERKKKEDQLILENARAAAKLYEEREAQIKQQRKNGRRIIDLQIEEHKINAILEAERKDRELKALMIHNNKIKQEDQNIVAERKAKQKAFQQDCLVAYQALQERKAEERRLEKEEAQMQIDFQNAKALREAAREKEIRDQKMLKEREIHEIRSKQQRAIDTKAIRDGYMAQRVQEDMDRAEYEAQQAEMNRQLQALRTIKKDREEMINTKLMDKLEQDIQEKKLDQQIIARAKEERAKAFEKHQAKLEQDAKYREDLHQQCIDQESRKKSSNNANEIEKIKLQNEQYQNRVERIKARKLAELEKEGVPEKYLSDIKHVRVQNR